MGLTQEYKVNSTPTKGSIDNLLRDAKKQADDIVLLIDSDISWGDLRDAITDRLWRSENVNSLTIIRDLKDATYKREDILKSGWEIKQADLFKICLSRGPNPRANRLGMNQYKCTI